MSECRLFECKVYSKKRDDGFCSQECRNKYAEGGLVGYLDKPNIPRPKSCDHCNVFGMGSPCRRCEERLKFAKIVADAVNEYLEPMRKTLDEMSKLLKKHIEEN